MMNWGSEKQSGAFRRRIVVVHRCEGNQGESRAVLEDDFHHFRVVLEHESEHVVHLSGSGLRHPYSLCPAAAVRLQALVGMRLDSVASSVSRTTDAREQCTHLLDLAGLALAAAANTTARRQYDIEVDDRVDGRTRALLRRDGRPMLEWRVKDTTIDGPAPFSGISLRDGLARWALATLGPEQAEAAIVLRRCALISLGRGKNLDAQVHAVPTGLCYAQQPGRAQQALRMVGSTWDFSASADRLCADDADWLAFREP